MVNGESVWLSGNPLYIMIGLVVNNCYCVTFPKFQKRFQPLVAIMVFGLVLGLGIETKTVADNASISGGFPPFHIPNIP
jgi:SulP family sulfate permease